MKLKMINVKAAVDADGNIKLQPNFAAFEAGVKRMIGCRFDHTVGELDKDKNPQGGYVMNEESECIPASSEYIKAVRDGDLIVTDQLSATICGVKFNAPAKSGR